MARAPSKCVNDQVGLQTPPARAHPHASIHVALQFSGSNTRAKPSSGGCSGVFKLASISRAHRTGEPTRSYSPPLPAPAHAGGHWCGVFPQPVPFFKCRPPPPPLSPPSSWACLAGKVKMRQEAVAKAAKEWEGERDRMVLEARGLRSKLEASVSQNRQLFTDKNTLQVKRSCRFLSLCAP